MCVRIHAELAVLYKLEYVTSIEVIHWKFSWLEITCLHLLIVWNFLWFTYLILSSTHNIEKHLATQANILGQDNASTCDWGCVEISWLYLKHHSLKTRLYNNNNTEFHICTEPKNYQALAKTAKSQRQTTDSGKDTTSCLV